MITGVNPHLLEQLQNATEGSRQLDQAIWEFIGRPGDDDPRMYAFEHGDCPLHYTTNLQDAVPLKPEDASLTLEIAPFQNAAWLKVPDMPVCSDHGTNRPIALVVCIAIIKSKEAEAA